MIQRRLWKRNWVVFTASISHMTWWAILHFDPSPMHTTPMALMHSIPGLSNQYVAAWIYGIAAAAALIPFLKPELDMLPWWWDRPLGLWLAGAQQILLMISCATAIWSLIRGCYPDGYVPDKYGSARAFILGDQIWPTAGMVAHTLSLVDWYRWSLEDAG